MSTSEVTGLVRMEEPVAHGGRLGFLCSVLYKINDRFIGLWLVFGFIETTPCYEAPTGLEVTSS